MRNLEKRVSNTYFTNNNGSLGHYLTDISKYKVLSDVEIRKLLYKTRRGDEKALTDIVNSNQRFVFSLSKRFSNGDDSLLLDLINEANIGLITAVKRFNPKQDNKFLTYAVYWMQRQIFLYLTFVNPIVKVSNKAKTTRVSDIKNRFLMINGRNPTTDEILNELENKFGIELINESDVYQISTTSIDNIGSNESNDDIMSIFTNNIENNETPDITSNNIFDDNINNDYSKTLISNSIGVLTEKEKNVIKLLYGIDNYREYEVQEVADKMGISKEGVRLINKRALEKLKDEIIVKREIV